MRQQSILIAILCLVIVSTASPLMGQWVTFQNQTSTRISASPAVSTADPEEKDYAFGDLDKDGDIDLICIRKSPLSCPGGRTAVLFMNENGVLTDRTALLAQASDVPGDLGFNTPANNRDSVIVDVDNDTWLDFVTCVTISDGLSKAVGHPRVYRNLGEIGGVWQGLRHEDFRIPQLKTDAGTNANPRFCEMAAGDVNGDGYADLYFADYDTGEVGPAENPANDLNNKLLINLGAANPGVFVDQSVMRMGSTTTYGTDGTQNYLFSRFGAGAAIVDLNMDGRNEVVKVTTLSSNDHVAVMRNNPSNQGFFDNYTKVDQVSPYHVSVADFNNDNKPDLVVSEDSADRYYLNTTTTVGAVPTFSSFVFGSDLSADSHFSGHSTVADLDNDGFKDVFIADVDIDTDGCLFSGFPNGRRSHLYRNLGNTPNVTLRELNPPPIPLESMRGVYVAAMFDINGDGWNDIVLGKCTSTGSNCGGAPAGSMEVWINQPPVGVQFTLQGGVPQSVTPANQTTVMIDAVPIGGTIQNGSVTIHTRINSGPVVSTPMTFVSGNTYSGQLPAAECPDKVYFHFSAIVSGGTFYDPSTAPGSPYLTRAADGVDVNLESFETGDNGWTVVNDPTLTAGAWVRVDPVGAINGTQQSAPEDDAEAPPNVMCWVTGQGAPGGAAGAADVDNGGTTLTSPPIDLSGSDAIISYYRWLYWASSADNMTVQVSNDNGGSWSTVEVVTTSSSSWQFSSFTVSDIFPGQELTANVRVRFTVADLGTQNILEGGVDAFQVNKFTCQAVPQCACTSDVSRDGLRDAQDIPNFIACYLDDTGSCACAELDHQPGITEGDLAAFVTEILAGDPCQP